MNKLAVFLPAALLGLSSLMGDSAWAQEDRSIADRSWRGGRYYFEEPPTFSKPLYYRPTQRYYGAGYTISYRYVPVYSSDSGDTVVVNGASNFRSEAFHLKTDSIPAWGANQPRLTMKDPRSAATRTAVTSIVRKKSTTRSSTTETPAEPAIKP
jgi:hypothetical protein